MSARALDAEQAASSGLDRYVAIHEFAELELELAGQGKIDDLESLGARWETLTADLPDRPPSAARLVLERATLLHERTHIELLRMREVLLADLANTGQVARAAHGYAPSPARHPQLDRCA